MSQLIANLGHDHWVGMTRAFRYSRGTFEYYIFYYIHVSKDPLSVDIQGYLDFDWVRDVNRRGYASGYGFQFLVKQWIGRTSESWWTMVVLSTANQSTWQLLIPVRRPSSLWNSSLTINKIQLISCNSYNLYVI